MHNIATEYNIALGKVKVPRTINTTCTYVNHIQTRIRIKDGKKLICETFTVESTNHFSVFGTK